jgi:hypothetical protein
VSGATQSSNLASTTFMGSHVRCSRLNCTLFTNSETHIISQPEIERNATTIVAVSVSLREIGGEPPPGIFMKFAMVN